MCVRVCVCVCAGVSSYLHCEWATEQQLEKDKRIQQKIKRFKMKQAQRALFFADVRLCGCLWTHCTLSLCVYTYLGIWCEQVCVFTIWCLLGYVCVVHMNIDIVGVDV